MELILGTEVTSESGDKAWRAQSSSPTRLRDLNWVEFVVIWFIAQNTSRLLLSLFLLSKSNSNNFKIIKMIFFVYRFSWFDWRIFKLWKVEIIFMLVKFWGGGYTIMGRVGYLGSHASILPALEPAQTKPFSGLILIQFIELASVSREFRNLPYK